MQRFINEAHRQLNKSNSLEVNIENLFLKY